MRILAVLFLLAASAYGYTNTVHRRELVERVPVNRAAASRTAARSGYIPTNTVAFRSYALDVLLSEANELNRVWSLGLPGPITSDEVTDFTAIPKLSGLAGGITVMAQYRFGISDGHLSAYFDQNEWWRALDKDPARQEALIGSKSVINRSSARQLAFAAITQLGLTNQPGVLESPVVTQKAYVDRIGKAHALPFFVVHWDKAPIEIEISGVTGRIVSYYNYGAPVTIPVPANYYEMLGITSDHSRWGGQFGYNSLDTDAFRAFAAEYITEKMNQLITAWPITSRPQKTNDITWILAEPQTNSFDVSARFGRRFQLQILDGRIQLFRDEAHNTSSFTDDAGKLRDAERGTNFITAKIAEAIARNAVSNAAVILSELGIREPPRVSQVEVEAQPGKAPQKLPLFEVFWSPLHEDERHGIIDPAIAVQISATSGQVAMFANNSPQTPKLPVPPRYLRLVASALQTNVGKEHLPTGTKNVRTQRGK